MFEEEPVPIVVFTRLIGGAFHRNIRAPRYKIFGRYKYFGCGDLLEEGNMSTSISLSRVVCDFLVLVACAIPLLIFHEFVKPYKRGFYCDDESIRYPLLASTVTRQMLIVVGILIPSALILATEVFRTLAWEKKCAHQFKSYHMRNTHVHRLIVRLYIFIGYFFLGVCFNQLMVDIAKYTIGRQRPHFMEVCKPNVGYKNCGMNHTYITDFWCTTTDKKLIHEAQLSFYSGHSSFSFYAAWYTSLYLQARLYRPLFSRLLLPVIQFSLFGGAAFVAYSRVSDYHHWSDVLVGSAMGSVIGIMMAMFIAEVFKRREIPSCVEMTIDGHQVNLMPLEKRPHDPELGATAVPSNTVVQTQTVLMTHDVHGPSSYNSGPVQAQRINLQSCRRLNLNTKCVASCRYHCLNSV
ncbi:hypothetical protein L596_000102 [Steinernema carpocapsae]|uniref:Phosphatidic acid phosphatase type 2/haloperoxidase domain-containing protein n=1 Tax=Steinernema carpocapsae TaxID=34508 RepID=A0A4U8UH76_STECR|nr:hypothetical protein L596_000102 [Steinernema carpocapsae]